MAGSRRKGEGVSGRPCQEAVGERAVMVARTEAGLAASPPLREVGPPGSPRGAPGVLGGKAGPNDEAGP